MCAARNPDKLRGLASAQADVAPGELRGPAARSRGRTRGPLFEYQITRNRRNYSRLPLALPLRVTRVAGQPQPVSSSLVTRDISSSGLYFLAPVRIEPGTPIELEVGMTAPVNERTNGEEKMRMCSQAHVVRVDPAPTPGWHGHAAAFDKIRFESPGGSGAKAEEAPPAAD